MRFDPLCMVHHLVFKIYLLCENLLLPSFTLASVLFFGMALGSEPPEKKSVLAISPIAHYLTSRAMCKSAPQSIGILQGSGFDPHSYQPTPKNLKDLGQAKILVWIGPTYEESFSAVKNSFSKATWITIQDGITSVPANDLTIDPHFWLSPTLAIEAVNQLGVQLIKHGAISNQEKVSCLQDFTSKVKSTEEKLKKNLLAIKTNNVLFATAHSAYNHFALAWGFKVISVTSHGGAHDFTPGEIQKKLLEIKASGVKVGFLELDTPPNVQKFMQTDAKLKLDGILTSDTLSLPKKSTKRDAIPSSDSLFALWEQNIKTVIAAFKGSK